MKTKCPKCARVVRVSQRFAGSGLAGRAATATSIVELLGIKAARDLSLDMSTKQK